MSDNDSHRPARVALVTGGGRGLGFSVAHRLAADGVAVMIVGRDGDTLDRAAVDLRAGGALVRTAVTDVSDADACAAAVAATVNEFGRLDVLVNAAGVFPRRPILELTPKDWHHVLDINVLGTYFMMTAAIAVMRSSGGGRIVNISSIDGVKAHPPNAHYAASKAAVISITRSVAVEVAPLGILVNAVAPGPIATDTAKATDWYEPMVAGLPTKTPIEPTEIAELVAYLASPANVSMAGENIIVSAGAVIA